VVIIAPRDVDINKEFTLSSGCHDKVTASVIYSANGFCRSTSTELKVKSVSVSGYSAWRAGRFRAGCVLFEQNCTCLNATVFRICIVTQYVT
jgi:hypothetical protein